MNNPNPYSAEISVNQNINDVSITISEPDDNDIQTISVDISENIATHNVEIAVTESSIIPSAISVCQNIQEVLIEINTADAAVAGNDGATGPIGLTGATGATGIIGLTGATGPIGASGPIGPLGASGPSNYSGQSPTTITVGGLPSGSDITDLPISDLLEAILVPYIAPTFSSFAIQQSTPVEVGTTLSSSQSFSFAFTEISNIQANTLEILDVTGGNIVLGTFALSPSPVTTSIGSIQFNSPNSYSWRGRATNTQSNTFLSSLTTVNWYWRIYYGTNILPILAEADIEGLASNLLTNTENRTYSFSSGGYKYFSWPDSFGSPTATTGFRDTSTNLSVSMADSSDNGAFSNVQNGWSYALVNITNINSVNTNYRVYRTKNILGGSINIQVS